ncbi:MAG: hypothetical protein ABIL70_07750 [candidate division WOR-3 bacterium]
MMKIWELVNIEHPLDYLTPPPTSTPIIDTITYRKDRSPDTLDNLSQKSPLNYVWLHDSVDIIVKAHNVLEGNDQSGIEAISYAVSDIRGNIVIPRYWLMDFGNLASDEATDTIKRDLVYAKGYRTNWNYLAAQANPYIVTNRDTFQVIVGALSNVKENCWPTKINKTWTANADSIEEARFKDGYYWVKVIAADIKIFCVTKGNLWI